MMQPVVRDAAALRRPWQPAGRAVSMVRRQSGGRLVKIRSIKCVGLVGETPKGGWTVELKPEDSVHTLVAVHTDAGVTGYGSVFTNPLLVAAALRVLEPLYRGEQALEPERVSEKLAQNSFWIGMAAPLTPTIHR